MCQTEKFFVLTVLFLILLLVLTEGKKRKRMGAQKKVKKSNESINSRLALVMKSGKLLGRVLDPHSLDPDPGL